MAYNYVSNFTLLFISSLVNIDVPVVDIYCIGVCFIMLFLEMLMLFTSRTSINFLHIFSSRIRNSATTDLSSSMEKMGVRDDVAAKVIYNFVIISNAILSISLSSHSSFDGNFFVLYCTFLMKCEDDDDLVLECGCSFFYDLSSIKSPMYILKA